MSAARIAFVHTAAIHEQRFDTLLASAQAEVMHLVRPDWLSEAQQSGLTPELTSQVTAVFAELAQSWDAVICTCTTLGPLADKLELNNLVRIDYPMMMVAAATEGQVLLALCLESTVTASTQLLEQAYLSEGRTPNITLVRCTQAWPHFEQQDMHKFEQTIADTLADAVADNPETQCIVLAQASMADAADKIRKQIPAHIKILRSPQLAVMHALLLAADQSAQQSQ